MKRVPAEIVAQGLAASKGNNRGFELCMEDLTMLTARNGSREECSHTNNLRRLGSGPL